jgi:hypothetical protein
MFVFIEEAAEAVPSADVQVCDCGWVGDRLGEPAQWSGIGDAPMGPVRVVATRKSHVVSELVKEVRRMSKA